MKKCSMVSFGMSKIPPHLPCSKKFTTKELTTEINQLSESLDPATISYWRKDEMRQKLKAVKKELDDQVRKAQADLVGIVSTEAKALVEKVSTKRDYKREHGHQRARAPSIV